MNFPFEMQPDRAAVSNRRAAQRGESIFRAFKKGFDPLTARFVFIRHAISPGLRSMRAPGNSQPPGLTIKH
jgi:hypothetical protein